MAIGALIIKKRYGLSDEDVVEEIREVIDTGLSESGTRLTDLHVWRVGKRAYSASLVLVTQDAALTPDRVREQLQVHEEIVHITVEINQHG